MISEQALSQLPWGAVDLSSWVLMASCAFVGLAAPAFQRAAQEKVRDIGIIKQVASMINRAVELPRILEFSLDELLKYLGFRAGAVRVVATSDIQAPLSIYRGFGGRCVSSLEDMQMEQTGLLRELSGKQRCSLDDLRRHPGGDELAQCLREDGIPHLLLYPVLADGQLLGTLALANHRAKALTSSQEALVSALMETFGIAIANGRLREQADKLSEDFVALQEVNKIISQSLDLENIIRRIVVEGKRLVQTRQCHLFLLDDRNQRLVGSASTQTDGIDIHQVEIKLSDDSIAVRALKERRVIAVEEFAGYEAREEKIARDMDWYAAIFAPLNAKEQAIGVLVCSDDAKARHFAQQEISRAETLAHQAAIALENARLFQVVSRSQKEWESTFDAMQDCVSVHDLSGKLIRANVALARRLKTTPQKMIGKTCSELYARGSLSFSQCHHMESLQAEGLIVEEVEVPSMDGTFQISVSPWYDKNNRLVGAIHVAKDVSHEKLLQQQLIQSEKLSAIGELISGIAHELNNPLTGVMGYSQLLQLRKDIDERAKENLHKINNLALRCQKIVQNLLSFARKQKPERTLTSINDILERTIELRNYELSVNNIEIWRRLDRNLPKTIADAHQLQQVFLNVITNAEHAMLQAHGRGRLEISSRSDEHGNRICVEIKDDGPGIPEDHLNKIFDPFFTTKEVGKGTGLGLSLTYGIIKEHGGNVYARSKIGEGTTFVIELPIIARIHDDPGIFPEMMPQARQFENLIRNKRILVVDDEKYILDFFVEVFNSLSVHVDTADDGKAALAMLLEKEYDLIITDFRMPQMSGRDLYHWITSKRPDLADRMIFVTGDTVSVETRSFFEKNCSRYLAKPFKIEEVKEVIQQTLEGCS